MMAVAFTESVVEEAALEWLKGIGYTVLNGPAIAVGGTGAERTDPNYRDVVLEGAAASGIRASQSGSCRAKQLRTRAASYRRTRRAVADRAQPCCVPDDG